MKKIVLLILFFKVGLSFAQFNLQRVWGTYYAAGIAFVNSKTDSEGNFIIIGSVKNQLESNSFYNTFTTPNTHQPNISTPVSLPSSEVFIAKFSPQGFPIWATYFGGTGIDVVSNLSLDSLDNIYIVGLTDSASGIATVDAHLPTLNASTAGFLAKFNSGGVLSWATYVSGRVFSVACSSTNNVYINGMTADTTGVATTGAYKETYTPSPNLARSYLNGFICSFDSSGSKIAGTYTGIMPAQLQTTLIYNNNVVILSAYNRLANDSLDNIIVRDIVDCASSNGSYGTPGVYQATCIGDYNDAFSKFSPNLTTRLWSTHFGGGYLFSNIYDFQMFNDNIYFCGSTNINTLGTVGVHQPVKQASTSAFIFALNGQGQKIWGTYFGGTSNSNIKNLTFSNDKIFISGSIHNPSNIATPGAFLTTSPNISNLGSTFFASFNQNNAQQNWCSYFGGENNDGINKMINHDNSLFLFGNTASTTNIATPNAFQPTIVGSQPNNGNMFINRFDQMPLSNQSFSTTGLTISPNPSNGIFNLKGYVNVQENLTLNIYDQLGRLVVLKKIINIDNNINQTINLSSECANGIYVAKLTSIDNAVLETFKILIN